MSMVFQRGEDAEGGEEAGEDDEPHGEAVDAEVVADGGGGDPGVVLLELEACAAACGVAKWAGRWRVKRKVRRVTARAAHCMILPRSGSSASRTRAGERDEEDEGEDGWSYVHGSLCA